MTQLESIGILAIILWVLGVHLVAGRYAAVSAYDYKVRCDFLEAELARVRELLATQLR